MTSPQQDAVDGTFVAASPQQRVDVTGADRVDYLENVTTQRLAELAVGDVRGALVLDAHGAPVAMFDVVVLGDRLVLVTPDAEVASAVVDKLGSRTFLADVRFESTGSQTLAVRGADTESVLAGLGLGFVAGRCRLADDLLIVARDQGADLIGPAEVIDDLQAALVAAGVRSADPGDLERWRVHAGVPAWGREVVHPHLPEEAGLLPTHVHLAKGCYPGQEAVARMWMLGRPRRRLARLAVDGEVVPGWTTGTGRDQVVVTSIAQIDGLALGYVPGTARPGDSYSNDLATVEVAALIGDDPAPPGHDPAVTRRRDRPAPAAS